MVAMAFRARALAALTDMGREASFEPKVRKVLKQGFLEDGQFEFALYEGSEAAGEPLMTGTNDTTVATPSATHEMSDVSTTSIWDIV